MQLSGGNFPKWEMFKRRGAIVLGGNCPGRVVQGRIVLGGNCQKGNNCPGGYCLEDNCPGGIVLFPYIITRK